MHNGLSEELDALAAFMSSLEIPDSPYTSASDARIRGQEIFNSIGCVTCHTPPLFTDQQLHDVGTGDPSLEKNSHGRGTNFDTPSLLGVWLTAPYFHDGSAATLHDVFLVGVEHNIIDSLDNTQLEDLISFMLALPYQ